VPIVSKESFDRDIQTKRDENWTVMVSHAEGIDQYADQRQVWLP
jgi:hypothetical protein